MNTDRIQALLNRLNKNLYEREQAVALSFLATVAGESIFFLGPPGVAKSMIAGRLKEVFRRGTSFEYLMSRFSTPDEIFGPVSISRLKDEDCYERVTQGYLPEATVVFLDEIWKAGPSIQNALLTVLNEKTFRNGNRLVHLPLQLTIAASNELPAEGEGLDALWDRFLVRCLVGGIRRADLFNRMISENETDTFHIPEEEQLTEEQLEQWRESARKVRIQDEVFACIHKIRTALLTFRIDNGQTVQEKVLYVSDRRWKKAAGLLRTSAFLCGASALRLADLLLLKHCLWDEPEQIGRLKQMLTESLTAVIEECIDLPLLADRIQVLRAEMRPRSAAGPTEEERSFKTVKSFFYQVERTSLARPVLIYISEYEQLNDRQSVPFILVDDKRKTGAQLLRLYQRSRYPNIFPKDLLDVQATSEGLKINGTPYPLLREKEISSRPAAADRQASPAMPSDALSRISFQMKQAREKLGQIKEAELEAASRHLFLNDEERNTVGQVFRKAEIDLERLEHEWKELATAHGERE
ncbi:MAG: AAA family ATPase [Paraprevotella sp.]|nr:AAA family ATPase [Paraprevotella sp.]